MITIARALEGWGRQKPSASHRLDKHHRFNRSVVARYRCNENAGLALADVGPKHTLDSAISGVSATSVWDTPGPFGGLAAHFRSASSQTGSTGSNGSGVPSGGPVSLECWFKTTSNSALQGILFVGPVGGSLTVISLFLNFNGNGSVSLEFGGNNGYRSGAGVYAANAWVHFLATWAGGRLDQNCHLYINGVEVSGTGNTSNVPALDGTGPIILGAFGNGSFFDGLIDNATVINRVTGSQEVLQRFQQPFAGEESGPYMVRASTAKIVIPWHLFYNQTLGQGAA